MGYPPPAMFGALFTRKPPTLERQLDALASCGIRLLPDATLEDLLDEYTREEFAKDPYRLLLIALGAMEPRRFSDDIWHFDTECIEDHGAYFVIADRLRDLANPDFPLVDLEDYVDLEANEAWVAFCLDGTPHRWTCEVQDDWVDPNILTRFAELLQSRKTGRRFTYLDLGGQDFLLGCATEAQLQRRRKITGLDWEWLT